MATTAPPGPEDRLDSWKEIAAYLKRGIRTVQRWEQSSGLPVRRLETERPSSVFAYKQEIDAWWASRQPGAQEPQPSSTGSPTAGRRWLVWAVAGSALLAGAGAAVTRWSNSGASETRALDPVPLTSDLGSEIDPTFSPDGNEVAYAWDGPSQQNWDIYVKMIGSDSPLRLTDGRAANVHPSWSPDGRFIAFTRFLRDKRASQIVVTPPTGGQERIVSEGAYDGPLSWSPDSRWIVAASPIGPQRPMALIALDVNTSEEHPLTKPFQENWGDEDPAVAPDGKTLVFARDLGSTSGAVPAPPESRFQGRRRTGAAYRAPPMDRNAGLYRGRKWLKCTPPGSRTTSPASGSCP